MPVFFHMQHPILVRSNQTLEMGQWDGNRRNNSLQKQTQGTWGFQAQALKELFLTHSEKDRIKNISKKLETIKYKGNLKTRNYNPN